MQKTRKYYEELELALQSAPKSVDDKLHDLTNDELTEIIEQASSVIRYRKNLEMKHNLLKAPEEAKKIATAPMEVLSKIGNFMRQQGAEFRRKS